ncbi:DNA repair/transcription protein [Blastomyces gilchristii SLH14081]|uniref:MMS19 nucleotide excision repair protein n=1 Tax=Blastomyces gilchristii (strain SLH14081) TaxID=559298 RepID=A0A179UM49_BLAGS|nr:DNA repair/transcription protein [Blastomyces gilchristii SLH14081]OAT08217.1 DNA repair/transcription protein [Blastomyces gilchristii SLH14081]
MSELQDFLLVVENNREEALGIASITAQKLESKQSTLIDVVQSLGEYINDENPIIRGKAVSYLTAVIRALSPKLLSRQQIQALTDFYCDRIADGGAIAGLDRLQGLERFTKDMTEGVIRSIFQHFPDLQARPQSQRFQLLQLLNGLMSNHRKALRDMGDESLVGIVDLVSGERDPRNLMLIFSILRVLMVEWDITKNVQALFDSVYNYFPITFKPPPNDPYGITAQDLKTRLQDCISSTQLFAPYAFPSLLDKLDSTSLNVKKDALNSLYACISSYDPATLSRYSISVWDTLKFEILNAQEEIITEESLRVLQCLAKRLSTLTTTSQISALAQYLKPITKECNEQLREPQQKQAQPARQILRSLSSASLASFALIIQAVVAPLLAVYQDADGIAKQRALLESFVVLFDSAIDIFGTWTTPGSDPAPENPLSSFQERLIEIFSQALMGSAKDETSFRLTSLQGLLRLSSIRGFLQENEIGLFVQYLDDILLIETSVRAELRKAAIDALAGISKHKPRLIMDIAFPAFMATLPDSDKDADPVYLTTLESLAQISIEKDIFETFVRRLLSRLEIVLQLGNTSTSAYPRAILLTILYAMDRKGLQNDSNITYYYDQILVKLTRRAALATTEDDTTTVMKDSSLLDVLGRLCNLIVRSLPREKQDEVCGNVYALFATDDSFIPIPFSSTTTYLREQTMILSTYLLAGLPKDSKLPYTSPDMESLLQELVRRAIAEENLTTHLALARHLALLVNKFLPTTQVPTASSILSALIQSSTSTSKPTPNEAFTSPKIRTIFWLAKALILRLAPSTAEILNSLLALLSSSDAQTSTTSGRGFALLLSPDDVLSPQNGAVIRLLSKQRVFSTLIPLISQNVRDLNTGATAASRVPLHTKQAYLTALSGILSTIPSSLVMPELPTLLPLLLQSLDLTDPLSQPIKAGTLETLAVIIRDNGVSVINEVGYVDDLVKRLLKTAVYNKNTAASTSTTVTKETTTAATSANDTSTSVPNTPHIRAQSLQCLLLLAQTPGVSDSTSPAAKAASAKPSPLLPLKHVVLRTLRFALDDPKRDVRKAAVDARAAWLRGVVDVEEDEED